MDTSSVVFIVIVAVIITAAIVYIIMPKGKITDDKPNTEINKMQLQAYERLLILVDRIALPNLISRINQPGANAKEMQLMLIQTIRQEFDYNITQQIYVTPTAWDALKNLKEQNLLIINQLANVLPPNANALDLNKLLLEFLMSDKKGSLHEVVSEALSYEARQLLQQQ